MPKCRCKWKPLGDYGVEAFELNQVYNYDLTPDGFYKVSIYSEDYKIGWPILCKPDYFYWLKPRLFNKIFKEGIAEIDIENDY